MKRTRIDRALFTSLREIVFGIEDSLVSTLGAVTGIAAGTDNSYVVILSGIVLIAVESTSMSAGSYLSTKSAAGAEEMLAGNSKHRDLIPERPLRAALVMAVFYALGGFIPLAPYLLLPIHIAYIPSIVFTVIALFATGNWVGRITKRSPMKSGLEMVAVSLAAAGIGFVIGRVMSMYFGINV